MITKQQVRVRLPGQQAIKTLIDDGDDNRIELNVSVWGWMDEVNTTNSFQVWRGRDCIGSYATLQEAMDNWEKVYQNGQYRF